MRRKLLPRLLPWLQQDNWLRELVDNGELFIVSPDVPFDADYQVEPDAINLRLHPLAMRLKAGVSEIDLQGALVHVTKYFEPCPIPSDGLQLQPGELVFCRTLETVEIRSDKYMGLVIGKAKRDSQKARSRAPSPQIPRKIRGPNHPEFELLTGTLAAGTCIRKLSALWPFVLY